MFAGFFYFTFIYEFQNPPVVENFTAEVVTVWARPRGMYKDGGLAYRAKLMRDDGDLTCGIPPQLVSAILPERTYEFEVSRSSVRCVIVEAEDVTPFDFLDK